MPKTQENGKVYRTAIYARLSKDDGTGQESNSIGSQKAICMAFLEKHPEMELVEIFTDDGYSGVDMGRPGFMALEEAAMEGRIDCIVCKDLSRIARNYIEGGRYLEIIFPRMGVRVIAINDGYDTLTGNPQSDSFIVPFKNLINDTYSKDISIKVRTNLDVKRKKGEFVGAYAPYGYKKDPENKNHLVIDEEAGETVKKIFTLFKDGMSIGQISDHLDKLGIPSPMEYKMSSGTRFSSSFRKKAEAKWSYRAVRRILSNEMYIGTLIQGKRGTPNYKVHEVRLRDESEWVRVEDSHDALVSFDDYATVKKLLERDAHCTGEREEGNIFSGFLFCADCGQTMFRKMVPSGRKKYHYFCCSSHRRHEGCSSHSISSKELESAVENAVKTQICAALDLSKTLERADVSSAQERMAYSYTAQIARLKEDIEKYKRMKLRLYEDLADGVIDRKEYNEFRNRYSGMISEKEEALKQVEREEKELKGLGGTESPWAQMFRKYENFEGISRRVLMALVDRILIYEDHSVAVIFRYGDEYRRAAEVARRFARAAEDRLMAGRGE